MAPLLIALIVLCCLLAAGAVYLLLALEVLPRFAAKKLRSGPVDETALSFPEDYDELRARVSVQKDLVYPSKYPANKFDLYLPKDADKAQPLPLVVWIHGGGFIAGEKEGTENVMTCLAAAGYAAVSLDYPVAPEHRYPAAIKAIDAFFAFLPKLSDRFPVDLTRIVLGGDSAGAQLAAQFAAKETNAELRARMCLPRRLLSPLKGVALVSGPSTFPPSAAMRRRMTKSSCSSSISGARHISASSSGTRAARRTRRSSRRTSQKTSRPPSSPTATRAASKCRTAP